MSRVRERPDSETSADVRRRIVGPSSHRSVCEHSRVRLVITGVNPPGRSFCRSDGSVMNEVHVGVQLRAEPAQLVRADDPKACWEVDVEVVRNDDGLDFRGPAVHGKKGERFVYLTWGHVDGGRFEMFRRAKLILDRVPSELIESAVEAGQLQAVVDLTGEDGGPRCARVDPPAVAWSVG